MSADLGVKLIAGYYAAIGVLALLLAGVLVFVGISLPFSTSAVPMGVLGVAVAGMIAVVPAFLGVFSLILAFGLWNEHEWGLYLAIAVGVLGFISALAAIALAGSLGSLPIINQAVPPAVDFVPGLIVGGGSAMYLFMRRGEFS